MSADCRGELFASPFGAEYFDVVHRLVGGFGSTTGLGAQRLTAV
ncbi:hypothetical protein [Actinokineospora enzanensis]|nr:hypothetical protein [Actinokineospora enzanensis]